MERPMYKKGWMRGDVIHFYYIPKDHRTQYIKPSRGDFIELIPKSEFEQLQQENKEHLQENKKKDEYIQILKNRIDAYDVLVKSKLK